MHTNPTPFTKLQGRATRSDSNPFELVSMDTGLCTTPPDITMPDQRCRLCDFLDRTEYSLSGNMKRHPEGEDLKGWFGADSDAWHQLAGFGAGPDGSALALWLYAGRDPSIAPVVPWDLRVID